MGKKDRTDPPAPKPDPGPTCSVCGSPKKDHTIQQLADCAASRN
jgi:hypothetical protein